MNEKINIKFVIHIYIYTYIHIYIHIQYNFISLYRCLQIDQQLYSELSSHAQAMTQKHPRIPHHETNKNIQVFIRIRPYTQTQPQQHPCVYTTDNKQITINTKQPGQVPSFVFDHIYESHSKQQQIYREISSNIIENAFIGINGTIFCYGQTSSGKTYTCIGKDLKDKQNIGILPRMIEQILQRIGEAPKHIEYKMKISMLQIYNQKIKDLLDSNKNDLKIRSDKSRGIFVENLTQKYLLSKQQANSYIAKGIDNRSVGVTQMNAVSSRSHMLFIITIHQQDLYTGQATVAKITLVDLAGSQKISRTGVQGKLLQEAKKINTSLSALGKVINILSQGKKSHIPYRDSKLTRLLQQSLGGNSLTKLIINVSPSITNEHQTLSSLRFGFRAKSIKNQPRINRQYTVPELLQLLNKAQRKIKLLTDVIREIMKQKNQQFMTFKQFVRQYVINNQQNNDGHISDQSDQAPLSLIKSISPTKMTNGKGNLNKSINNNKNTKDKDKDRIKKIDLDKIKGGNKDKGIDKNKNKQKYNPQLQQFYSPQRQPLNSSKIKASAGELSLVNLFKSIDLDLKKNQNEYGDQIFSARQIKKHTRGKSFNNDAKSNIDVGMKIKIKDEQSDKQSLLLQQQSKQNKQQYLLQDFQQNYQQQSHSQSQQSQQHEHEHEHEHDYSNNYNYHFKLNNQFSGINSPDGCRSFIGSSCTFNSKILDMSISAMSPLPHQYQHHHNHGNSNGNGNGNSNSNRISSSTVNLNMNLNQSVIPQSSFFTQDTIQFNIAEIRNNLRKLKCMQKRKSMAV